MKKYSQGKYKSGARAKCVKAAKIALEGEKCVTYKGKEIKMSKEQISVFDQIFLFKTENADISLNYHDNHCGIKVGGKIRYGTISNRIGYLMKRETLFFNNFEKEGLRERDSGIKEFGIPSTYSCKKYNPSKREIPSKVLIIIE